jgi:hypothetical protein
MNILTGIQFESIKTLHSNDIHLDETETPLAKMVDKDIDVIYRPREEKEENLRYKEERKKAEKESDKMEKDIPQDDDNDISDVAEEIQSVEDTQE